MELRFGIEEEPPDKSPKNKYHIKHTGRRLSKSYSMLPSLPTTDIKVKKIKSKKEKNCHCEKAQK
jgi:hypothetical protein